MTQFNVIKVIYISKVAGVEVRPQCGACLVEIWGRNPILGISTMVLLVAYMKKNFHFAWCIFEKFSPNFEAVGYYSISRPFCLP